MAGDSSDNASKTKAFAQVL
jgi:hypothetical protein